jgi:hypothetical protein
MTRDDVEAYKWAQSSKDYLLENCLIQSTWKSKEVAKMFSKSLPRDNKLSLLTIFNFEEKCWTAIQLVELANFEIEQQVLLYLKLINQKDEIYLT